MANLAVLARASLLFRSEDRAMRGVIVKERCLIGVFIPRVRPISKAQEDVRDKRDRKRRRQAA